SYDTGVKPPKPGVSWYGLTDFTYTIPVLCKAIPAFSHDGASARVQRTSSQKIGSDDADYLQHSTTTVYQYDIGLLNLLGIPQGKSLPFVRSII
ncbi:hypothetical protein RCM47_03230, partial [Escherichia coli]|nr:hypothetical protein [Escherichia coli]